MTDQQHPITPPFELMNQWYKKACKDPYSGGKFIMAPVLKDISNSAAQWGADQELEAILEIVGFGQQSLPEEDRYLDGLTVASIRAARRPKPPSLKEVALEDLRSIELLQKEHKMVACTFNIRRALEQLND